MKNPEASGNVSIENEEVYKLESGRLATFNNWPVSFIVTPEALAKTGFYYLKQGDKVINLINYNKKISERHYHLSQFWQLFRESNRCVITINLIN